MEANQQKRETIDKLFRASRLHMGPEAWENLLKVFAPAQAPEELPSVLARHAARLGLPDYLPELARLNGLSMRRVLRRQHVRRPPAGLP